jgi:hypothetical protein
VYVRYEWVIEPVDQYGDIVESDHADSFEDAMKRAAGWRQEWKRVEVGLVRELGDDVEGLQDRQWAYIEDDGTLPAKFDGGARVPKRFMSEIAAALLAQKT